MNEVIPVSYTHLAASGNGPVDAAIKALKKIIDRHMTLKEFTIQEMCIRDRRYTVSGQAKALSIPPGEYAGNGETQRN